MRFALLLLFVGCTTAQPTTYERGAFRPPPPAQVRPGVGAPIHDPYTKPLPPQPQPRPKRYLPPEPDGKPGIWASEEPQVAPRILPIVGVPIPVPEPRLAEDEPHARQCADVLRDILADQHAIYALAAVPPEGIPCAITRAYNLCLGAYGNLAAHTGKHEEHERLERLLKAGKEAEARACRDWIAAGEVRRFTEAFVLAWRKR